MLWCITAVAQYTVRGKITDEGGETMVGVTIALKSDKKIATSSDLDGNFSLRIPVSTPQTLVISFISYQPIEEKVESKKGEVVVLDLHMEPLSKSLNEVVVSSRANKSDAHYMQSLKAKSIQSIDFVSAASMKRVGDANVSAAVSRVTGVSTTSNGFFTVRGIGDRYVKTAINGSRIPTLDPLTNNIKLDLFPASLVDNIIITKTASADLPGDWAGAYLSIETKDYPDKLTITAETAYGYTVQTSFKDVIASQRSSTDWLGYDNGLREYDHAGFSNRMLGATAFEKYSALGLNDYFSAIGVTANTPWNDTYDRLALVQLGLLDASLMDDASAVKNARKKYSDLGYDIKAMAALNEGANESLKRFSNTWIPITRRAPLNNSQSFSIGNQSTLFGHPLGYIVGFRYSSSTQSDRNAETGTVRDTSMIITSHGARLASTENNGWSALCNLAYKFTPNNSLSIMFMPNVVGISKVRSTDKATSSHPEGLAMGVENNWINYDQYYESRKQLVYQAKTEHYIPAIKMKIEGNASYTNGSSAMPDMKRLNAIKGTDGNYTVDLISYPISRGFDYVTENIFDSRLSIEQPLGGTPELVRRLKIGGAYQQSKRNEDIYLYEWRMKGVDWSAGNDLNAFLSRSGDTTYLASYDYPTKHNFGTSNTKALFGLIDYSVVRRVRLSAGMRIEQAHIHTDFVKYDSAKLADNDSRRNFAFPSNLDKVSFLPSANLLIKLSTNVKHSINLRLNYSRTVARPSMRELIGSTTFDYGLSRDIIGNPNLKMTSINNYDLRVEAFFESGENVSVSAFYKDFTNHIEMIDFGEFCSWTNSGKAWVRGLEFEGKKKLFKQLEFSANVTLAQSQEESFARWDELRIRDTLTHQMFGQAPYVVNTMLTYSSDSLGLSATLSYNTQGARLSIAGNKITPGIYEMPRHSLDFKLSKTIGKHFSANVTIKDILHSSIVRSYLYNGKEVVYDKYTYGTLYQLALSYKF